MKNNIDKIAIIIPVHNRKDKTLEIINNFKNSCFDFDHEVIIIDDGSTDGTSQAIIREFDDVKILYGDGSLWWAGAINKGFKYAVTNDFNYIYTINDDVNFNNDTLKSLYNFSKKNPHCIVASLVKNPNNNKVISSGYRLKKFPRSLKILYKNIEQPSHSSMIMCVDACSSMSTLLPVSVVKDNGYYDSNMFEHNFSDIEYSLRFSRAGGRVLIDWKSIIYSEGSTSNFHSLIIEKNLSELVNTFFDIKYAHNFKTLYRSSTVLSNPFLSPLVFVRRFFPFIFWFLIKIILPKKTILVLLEKTNRC